MTIKKTGEAMNKKDAESKFIYGGGGQPLKPKLTPQELRYYDLHQASISDEIIAKIFEVTVQAIYNIKHAVKDKGYPL